MKNKKAINKHILAEIIAKKIDNDPKHILTIIETMFDTIIELTAEDIAVRIVGFGTFDVTHRASRPGINPETMERIIIPPLTSPTFRAGSNFKQKVKKQDHIMDYHMNVVVPKQLNSEQQESNE